MTQPRGSKAGDWTLEEIRQEALAINAEAAGHVARCGRIRRETNILIAVFLLGMILAWAGVWLFPPWLIYAGLAAVTFAVGWLLVSGVLTLLALHRMQMRNQEMNARLAELDEILRTHWGRQG